MTKGSERLNSFLLTVEATYWKQGFFNITVDYERFIGGHGESIDIHCQHVDEKIEGTINRTANSNGTPRVMGRSALKRWFQETVRERGRVKVTILSPNSISLRATRTDDPVGWST